jgi:hypothetical protein
LRRRPYTVAAVVGFLAMGITFCLRKDSEWDAVFVRAAVHLWAGEDIYQNAYMYPPFLAWACLPFAWLPVGLGRMLWFAINVTCAMGLIRYAWRLAGGGRLEGNAKAPFTEHRAAILGVLCGIPYIENCFAHMQTDVVLGALLMAGCLLLAASRGMWAATCLGVAAAIKCTPLLFAPYLAWRGRARSAVWLVVVALGVNFLPDLVNPSPSGLPWLADFARRYLFRLTNSDHYVGTWGSDPMYNQSLSGAANRWLLTTLTWTDTNCIPQQRALLPDPNLVRTAAYVPALVLLFLAAWAAGWPGRKAESLPGTSRVGLECSIVVLLMLLLSPMSSKAHFGVLVLPGFCLASAASLRPSRLVWGLLLAGIGLGFLSYKAPLGERLYTISLWSGIVTWQTLVLLFGCMAALVQLHSHSTGATAQDSGNPLRPAA